MILVFGKQGIISPNTVRQVYILYDVFFLQLYPIWCYFLSKRTIARFLPFTIFNQPFGGSI
jgi:hypothetical protein